MSTMQITRDRKAIRTSWPFAKAFACAGVTVVVVIVAALVWLGGMPANAEYAGELLGGLIFRTALAAFATGLYARTGVGAWSPGRVVATYVAVLIAISALLAVIEFVNNARPPH